MTYPLQYIVKLREFIQRSLPEETAYALLGEYDRAMRLQLDKWTEQNNEVIPKDYQQLMKRASDIIVLIDTDIRLRVSYILVHEMSFLTKIRYGASCFFKKNPDACPNWQTLQWLFYKLIIFPIIFMLCTACLIGFITSLYLYYTFLLSSSRLDLYSMIGRSAATRFSLIRSSDFLGSWVSTTRLS